MQFIFPSSCQINQNKKNTRMNGISNKLHSFSWVNNVMVVTGRRTIYESYKLSCK